MRPNKLGIGGLVVMLIVGLVAGFGLGRVSGGGGAAGAAASSPTAGDASGAAATATRTAELAEISQLQTRVAQTPPAVVCTAPATNTPSPSPTPSPTATLVPPAGAGTPVPYAAGKWTVAARDVTLLQKFADVTPTGVFAQVSLSITNNDSAPHPFPYLDLILRDSKGRVFIPSIDASVRNPAGLYNPFAPNLPNEGFVIFDIAKDATGPFILESKTDPTFRVTVNVAERG